jgi:hypothetical protein
LDGSSAGKLAPELARHERTEERLGYRNGYRPRIHTTQVSALGSQSASPIRR